VSGCEGSGQYLNILTGLQWLLNSPQGEKSFSGSYIGWADFGFLVLAQDRNKPA
jgi:hypothetical protein